MGKATAGRVRWVLCGGWLSECALGVACVVLVASGGVLCRHLVGEGADSLGGVCGASN